MNRTLVHDLLERVAQGRPEKPFLICEGASVSYGQIEAKANQVAHLLLGYGLARGTRVGLLAQNGRFYVACYYGILKAGGIVVPLNTAEGGQVLGSLLTRCEAEMLLASTRFGKLAEDAALACPRPPLVAVETNEGERELPAGLHRTLLDEDCEHAPTDPPGLDLIDTGPASIVYTSGSVGGPKGVTLSHRNILSNTRSIVQYLGLGAEDRVLCILPFYYVYGKSLLNTHAAVGGTVVIENRFAYPQLALDTMEDEACTGLSGVPSTFAILLSRSNFMERRLKDLRYVTQAGAPMSPEATRRLMKALPDKKIFVMYGATEASARLSYLSPSELPRKIGSIGRAIPGVELRVLRPDGTEADVGQEGEIVARGPNVMLGYWGDEEGTAEVLDAAGYHTGDMARRDEDGFLFITGRIRDFIKAGAHRISAMEIEAVILESPEVHEVAAVGVPDEILGERIRVYLVPRDHESFDQARFTKVIRDMLPAHKMPTEIILRSDLPKNESGKIMKQVLRQESLQENT